MLMSYHLRNDPVSGGALNSTHSPYVGAILASVERDGVKQTRACSPVTTSQTVSHIVNLCPSRKLDDGLSRLSSADDDAVWWLANRGTRTSVLMTGAAKLLIPQYSTSKNGWRLLPTRDAVCARTKINWTKTAHDTRVYISTLCRLIHTHSHIHTAVWLQVEHWAYWRPQLVVAK